MQSNSRKGREAQLDTSVCGFGIHTFALASNTALANPIGVTDRSSARCFVFSGAPDKASQSLVHVTFKSSKQILCNT
jgi:hypothetical protein